MESYRRDIGFMHPVEGGHRDMPRVAVCCSDPLKTESQGFTTGTLFEGVFDSNNKCVAMCGDNGVMAERIAKLLTQYEKTEN